jgi:CRISPR-associated protein Cas1
LYGLVWQAVIKAGLDPYFGIVHGAKRDHGSLVFDLIEEFRAPFADRLVFALLGRGFIPKQNQDGLLNTISRKKLVQGFVKKWRKEMAWRSQNLPPDRILASQARSLAGFFLREKRYQPFRMRW